jgi:hypothetical protein
MRIVKTKPRCSSCQFCEGYYRYKTDSTGQGRLVNYYCEHESINQKEAPYGFITMSRRGIYSKISFSPIWCPIRGENKESGGTSANTASTQAQSGQRA